MDIYFGNGLHRQRMGPITYTSFKTQTASLSGANLEYLYLCAIEESDLIAVSFLPGGGIDRVKVWSKDGLTPYQRSGDEESMRATVKSAFGDTADLPRAADPLEDKPSKD